MVMLVFVLLLGAAGRATRAAEEATLPRRFFSEEGVCADGCDASVDSAKEVAFVEAHRSTEDDQAQKVNSTDDHRSKEDDPAQKVDSAKEVAFVEAHRSTEDDQAQKVDSTDDHRSKEDDPAQKASLVALESALDPVRVHVTVEVGAGAAANSSSAGAGAGAGAGAPSATSGSATSGASATSGSASERKEPPAPPGDDPEAGKALGRLAGYLQDWLYPSNFEALKGAGAQQFQCPSRSRACAALNKLRLACEGAPGDAAAAAGQADRALRAAMPALGPGPEPPTTLAAAEEALFETMDRYFLDEDDESGSATMAYTNSPNVLRYVAAAFKAPDALKAGLWATRFVKVEHVRLGLLHLLGQLAKLIGGPPGNENWPSPPPALQTLLEAVKALKTGLEGLSGTVLGPGGRELGDADVRDQVLALDVEAHLAAVAGGTAIDGSGIGDAAKILALLATATQTAEPACKGPPREDAATRSIPSAVAGFLKQAQACFAQFEDADPPVPGGAEAPVLATLTDLFLQKQDARARFGALSGRAFTFAAGVLARCVDCEVAALRESLLEQGDLEALEPDALLETGDGGDGENSKKGSDGEVLDSDFNAKEGPGRGIRRQPRVNAKSKKRGAETCVEEVREDFEELRPPRVVLTTWNVAGQTFTGEGADEGYFNTVRKLLPHDNGKYDLAVLCLQELVELKGVTAGLAFVGDGARQIASGVNEFASVAFRTAKHVAGFDNETLTVSDESQTNDDGTALARPWIVAMRRKYEGWECVHAQLLVTYVVACGNDPDMTVSKRVGAFGSKLLGVFDSKNKGYAMVQVGVKGRTVKLVSTHFPSGDTQEEVEKRADALAVVAESIELGARGPVLIGGDFNTRLTQGLSEESGYTILPETRTQKVVGGHDKAVQKDVARQFWDGKYGKAAGLSIPAYSNPTIFGGGPPWDELLREKEEIYNRQHPHGLREEPINFPPTYRIEQVDRIDRLAYSPKRVPGWTDRVLYRGVYPTSYTRLLVPGSDHLPVQFIGNLRL